MTRWTVLAAITIAFLSAEAAWAAEPAAEAGSRPLPGPPSDYHGFDRYDLTVDGCRTIVVAPKTPLAGRPWIWRAEFFDAFPQVDLAILARGFHLAYIDVGNTFGCPDALAHWDVLYRELTEKYGFSRKPVLEGLSRGGLYCFNWAASHPDKVGCILADNAVMDFKSWPGGKGKGPGSPEDWKKLLADYHFSSEAAALAYQKNPVDNLALLAEAGVPLFLLCGDADEVVPYPENGAIVKERYERLGGPVKLLVKKGLGHHPHGLDDPSPVVEFILAHAAAQSDGGPSQAKAAGAADLPPLPEDFAVSPGDDWLVRPVARNAGIYRGRDARELVMTNGLVRRTWRLAPNAATVEFDNLATGEALLRGVKPEARLRLDGKDYDVGGLVGQPDYAYLRPEWLDAMTADPAAFRLVGFETGKTAPRLPWKRVRAAEDRPWPPPGVSLVLRFAPPAASDLGKLAVSIHYEMYDGIPLLCKWLSVENGGPKPIRLEKFTSEILAVVESESVVDIAERWRPSSLHVESDYAFCGMAANGSDQTSQWLPDPDYATQVNYELATPCLLESRPPIGPDQSIEPGGSFESFRTFELALDSGSRERRGLALRRMYRTIAPWVTENPILMHVTSTDPQVVKTAIDQCAAVGFEMVILSFGSGLNMEDPSPENHARMKELADYARSKGIEIGGYSLLASRSISPEMDAINPKTGQPGGARFGNSPCLESEWGRQYFANLRAFFTNTGMNVLEHDGSYPGDVCASTKHAGHRGLEDSQWRQWKAITDFYKWCRGEGIYLNVPDFYFLAGSNKTGMGYRETNWSLPRAQQILHARQNIYDGTWEKTPSMGWMFVPLVQYHGGGAAATLEPLSEHLPDYEAHLANLFGAGVQACYRGWRLYDSDETRAVVEKWVAFYKRHRAILDSDIIHVRRADGRDIDSWLHVNPRLKTKGLAMVYNPLDQPVKRSLLLPLYYTGLTEVAQIRREEGPPVEYKLDRHGRVSLPVEVPARGVTWFVIE